MSRKNARRSRVAMKTAYSLAAPGNNESLNKEFVTPRKAAAR